MPQTWRVVSLLCAVTCVGYLVRADVAVAQERMVPALALTMTAMGAITAWGWIGTLAFWSAACVVAALLWMTVQVDGEPAAPACRE